MRLVLLEEESRPDFQIGPAKTKQLITGSYPVISKPTSPAIQIGLCVLPFGSGGRHRCCRYAAGHRQAPARPVSTCAALRRSSASASSVRIIELVLRFSARAAWCSSATSDNGSETLVIRLSLFGGSFSGFECCAVIASQRPADQTSQPV